MVALCWGRILAPPKALTPCFATRSLFLRSFVLLALCSSSLQYTAKQQMISQARPKNLPSLHQHEVPQLREWNHVLFAGRTAQRHLYSTMDTEPPAEPLLDTGEAAPEGSGAEEGGRAEGDRRRRRREEEDARFMRLALRHADWALRAREVPVGAIIVDKNGEVVAAGRNSVEKNKDATCHAEINCLKTASKVLDNWRLLDCTLYCTLEPCVMCLAAIQNFRVRRVVYGARDHRLGACGTYLDLPAHRHPFHQLQVTGGVLAEESSDLLKQFFRERRTENEE